MEDFIRGVAVGSFSVVLGVFITYIILRDLTLQQLDFVNRVLDMADKLDHELDWEDDDNVTRG